MKNKTLAIFGIGTYILSIITSATDLEGNSTMPIALIAISGMAIVLFYVITTIRLWKVQKSASILLISSALILGALSIVQSATPSSYGSSIIVLLNITKVINFIAFIWAVSLLWAMAKHE